ncbi:transposable element Tcb1 transposase [Trichonephila clavipes]|nr:transposable element Tcb1 transposase [Trichonephila clavipes]
MARIVRHNDESVREGYIRNAGKEVKLFTSALKAFQCNNRIVMAQMRNLDDFYVVELLDDWNVDVPSWKYPRNLESPRVSSPGFGNDSKMMVINRRSTASDLSRQLSSATGTTVSRQTVYRRLGHIGLYARRPVRCVPLTATHCRLRLTWSREHALWTPQQWSCVMFPGTRYHQENTIERHLYSGAGWLVWGGIILGSRTDLHVQSVTMTGHIYRDVILEQHNLNPPQKERPMHITERRSMLNKFLVCYHNPRGLDERNGVDRVMDILRLLQALAPTQKTGLGPTQIALHIRHLKVDST